PQADDPGEAGGDRFASQGPRAGRLQREGPDAGHDHDVPHVAHRRLRRPMTQAAPAATIGTPAGVNGVRTRAIAAPMSAAIAGGGAPIRSPATSVTRSRVRS